MKKLLLAGLVALLLLLSGCGVSDYMKQKEAVGEEENFSLLEEKEIEESIENITEEAAEVEKDSGIKEAEEASEEKEEEVSTKVDKASEEDFDIVIKVKEGELVNLQPKVLDPDNDAITFTYSEPLDKNGEWQTDYGDAGKYIITITASDGTTTTEKQILLVVERVNVPPVIEGVEDKIVIDEGDVLELKPHIYDPNKDEVTVSISQPVGDDGIWETDYQSAGEYTVVITASDGELETIKEIQVVVNRKNVAPIIEELEDVEVDEGEIIEVTPKVTDLNADEITITFSEPEGKKDIWREENGTFIWNTTYTDHGKYVITVTASDGELESTTNFTVTINDINMPPEIIDVVNVGESEESETTTKAEITETTTKAETSENKTNKTEE
ncbi:hypothetical protein KY307_00545 [Candidatus Woesearchaeota archaeon]|nr:hypothetical protein [Candidatus Woesearchaeota archaeon]